MRRARAALITKMISNAIALAGHGAHETVP
jgi:hypothetical protein